jgi:CubicO group peptidase (beta-lactamase class C family)
MLIFCVPVLFCFDDAEAFIDGMMKAHLSAYNIRGAAAALVTEGSIRFAKGYGFADKEGSVRTNGHTAFHAASVSKVLVWAALLQLADEGKIDLAVDVNTYLSGWELPRTFPAPVTAGNLATHTAGFEEKNFGALYPSPTESLPLDRYLRDYMPARIYRPGELCSYSNYGSALGAYLVQEVSGVPFTDYCRDNLYQLFNLQNTTFNHPPEEHIDTWYSPSFVYTGEKFTEQDFPKLNDYPAGSLTTTAADMGRLMTHLLADYRRNGPFRPLFERRYAAAPDFPGMTFGLLEMPSSGRTCISHGGDAFGYHSLLAFLPEEGFGFFAVYNSPGGAAARNELFRAVTERWLSAEPAERPDEYTGLPPVRDFAGYYRTSRVNLTTLEKTGFLFSFTRVSAGPKGLSVDGSRYRRTGPYRFVQEKGDSKLLFVPGADGMPREMHDYAAVNTSLKLPWFETPVVTAAVLGFTMLMFVSVLITGIIVFFKRRGGGISPPSSLIRQSGEAFIFGSSFLALFFLISFTAVSTGSGFLYGLPVFLKVLLRGSWFFTGSAVLGLILAAAGWIGKYWSVRGRIFYTAAAVSFILFVWFLHTWNLLGLRL